LAALSNLQQLSVSLVPMPSLVGLQQLPNLHSLVLSQVQPLTSYQCSTLARCQQLRNISLSSLQWSDIAELALLTGEGSFVVCFVVLDWLQPVDNRCLLIISD
jgi:hypothetical protein